MVLFGHAGSAPGSDAVAASISEVICACESAAGVPPAMLPSTVLAPIFWNLAKVTALGWIVVENPFAAHATSPVPGPVCSADPTNDSVAPSEISEPAAADPVGLPSQSRGRAVLDHRIGHGRGRGAAAACRRRDVAREGRTA